MVPSCTWLAPIHSTKTIVPITAVMMSVVSMALTRVLLMADKKLISARSLKRLISFVSCVYACTVGTALSISPASAEASAILS